ncbi:MAG: Mercuric reductase [Chlamydiae bacterium]|nr:Mercuric reductase [Chlamydiota bacterium]
MKYDYDIICIGLGPAGMAVSIMASEMGLKVCGIEKDKIGGECMNVGCVPSKALLKMARVNKIKFEGKEISLDPTAASPFQKIRDYVELVGDTKTSKMFKKVDLILGEGHASFIDNHTVEVGGRKVSAKCIFLATGTEPAIPPIPGIDTVDILTNKNLFGLNEIPKSMTVLGGGAIGTEMAQAFSRFGTKCTVIHMDSYLVPVGDPEAGSILQDVFEKEGIKVHNGKSIVKVEKRGDNIALATEDGVEIVSEKLLVAAGRKIDLTSLNLENAGVRYGKGGIEVNRYLQTTQRNIYAVGDCNGNFLLTHAAMHQGMIALINSMNPWPFKKAFEKYIVPWTVFTEPQVSCVGMREKELKSRNISYETIVTKYEDYGVAIAEEVAVGFVKVFASSRGKIYGVSIIGEGSGEMINEWALAIQKKIRIYDIMFCQHSFPTMGFLSKRAAETWMMGKMQSKFVKKVCKTVFKLFS